MKKYSDKGWNWLIDHYPHEPGRYWFEGFNPVEGYPNKPDLTRKDIHVLADVDDITHPLDATAVTNGEPLYNLFFFATLPGADNLVRFKRFDEEAKREAEEEKSMRVERIEKGRMQAEKIRIMAAPSPNWFDAIVCAGDAHA
ncbi:hypothetical protein HMPREF9465_00913 [Sutterella wadsworthensis 2_1_59BFAA]|uniref:Uncharacterized protein n=2 Tax=Sutterella wadsworthensis TaxID=40545 RepID=K1KIB9_9BURK|nr:hypothetical protein HMPREF9465_00913 [Sutterella wadsworthensis 2_1_59BFAA]